MDEWTLDEERIAARAVAKHRASQHERDERKAVPRGKDGKIPYQIIDLPRRTVIINWVSRLVMIAVGVAVVVLIALNIRPDVQAALSGSQQVQTAVPAAPPRYAPPVKPQGASTTFYEAPTPAPALPIVPPGLRAAWAPGGEVAPDVTGRRYRVLTTAGEWQQVELDDGARVWLGPQATPAPVYIQPTPVPPTPNVVNTIDPARPVFDTTNQEDMDTLACLTDLAYGGAGCTPTPGGVEK